MIYNLHSWIELFDPHLYICPLPWALALVRWLWETGGNGWDWEALGQWLLGSVPCESYSTLGPILTMVSCLLPLTKSLPYPRVCEWVWVSKTPLPQSLFWFSALYSRDWCFSLNLDPCRLQDWRSTSEPSPFLSILHYLLPDLPDYTNVSLSQMFSHKLGVKLPLISCFALHSNCGPGVSLTCVTSHSWFMHFC